MLAWERLQTLTVCPEEWGGSTLEEETYRVVESNPQLFVASESILECLLRAERTAALKAYPMSCLLTNLLVSHDY